MASFHNTQTCSIDHKGRLSVPVAMRREGPGRKTHDRFFLKYGTEGCLQLYSVEGWEQMEAKLRKLQRKGPRERGFVRAFRKDAYWVTVDAQGRISISPALTGRAGLGKEALLHGNIEYIEIWNPEKYSASMAAMPDEKLSELEPEMLGEE